MDQEMEQRLENIYDMAEIVVEDEIVVGTTAGQEKNYQLIWSQS